MNKKLLSFILVIALTLSNCMTVGYAEPVSANAAEAGSDEAADPIPGDEGEGEDDSLEPSDDTGDEAGTVSDNEQDTDVPDGTVEYEDGEISLDEEDDLSIYDDLAGGSMPLPHDIDIEEAELGVAGGGRRNRFAAAEYPSYYVTDDLPNLRNQGSYGTCWAHASLALAEISLIRQGYYLPRNIDLSELQLAYFSYNSVTDPLGGTEGDVNALGFNSSSLLNNGGNVGLALNVLASWTGAAAEAEVPYSRASNVEYSGLDDKYAYDDEAHLTGIYKTRFNTSDLTPVKKLIYENGAVAISFYANSQYYNRRYNSYYCTYDTYGNHAVTVVGWDDDFPADRFSSRPAGNGAWLVRNSWTTGNFDSSKSYNGYFWMSYYDRGLDAEVYSFKFEPKDNFQNIYQYDGAMDDVSTGYSKGANVFTAHSETGEYGETLKAVSFSTDFANVDYTIDIYTSLRDRSDPESGTKKATLTGSTTYAGFYEVRLDEEIDLEPDEVFSVVVTLDKSGSVVGLLAEGACSCYWYRSDPSAKRGQSFVQGYEGWKDYSALYEANLRIKAYTDDMDEAEAILPEGIGFEDDLEQNGLDISVEQSVTVTPVIEPSNATRRTVEWTSSDESVAMVSPRGVITGMKKGTCTITATTVYGGYSASFEVRVNTDLVSIEIEGDSKLSRSLSQYQYRVEMTPRKAEVSGNVIWNSLTPELLTIDDNGLASIHKCGHAKITAELDGKKAVKDISIEIDPPDPYIYTDIDNRVTISWPAVPGADCYSVSEGLDQYDPKDDPIYFVEADDREYYSFVDTSHMRDEYRNYTGYFVWAWDGYVTNGKGAGIVALIRGYDYRINYVTNGAQNSADNPKGYRKGQRIELVPPVPAEGYESAEWCTDRALKNKKTAITPSDSGNLTLYARNYNPFRLSVSASDGSDVFRAYSFENAVQHIKESAKSAGDDVTWEITLFDDISLGAGAGVDLRQYADRVSMDLGGHTFTVGKGGMISLREIRNGTLAASDALISGNGISIERLNATGTIEVTEGTGLGIGVLTMKSGLFDNKGRTTAEAVTSINKLDNRPGASFETQSFAMLSSGAAYLEPGSVFHVDQRADIYNLYIGQDYAGRVSGGSGAACITMLKEADISIYSKLQAKDAANDRLEVKTVRDTGEGHALCGTGGGTILFNTNIKSFPTGLIELIQPEYAGGAGETDYTKYNTLLQQGNTVLVTTDWIELYAGDDLLKSFSGWSDAVSYVNTINNAGMDYSLVLKEDVTSYAAMTLPARARSFTIKGTDPDAPVRLIYTGNISLTTDTRFENLILEPKTYNSRTGKYDTNNSSTVNLNGRAFTWINTYTDCSFSSVNGSGAASFTLDAAGHEAGGGKMKLSVINNINVPKLFVMDYALESQGGALTVGSDAYLKSADIDVKTNITIRNLHTLDPYNTISLAKASNNSFNITGSVDGLDADGNDTAGTVSVTVRGEDDQASDTDDKAQVNSNAVSIRLKYIEEAVITGSDGSIESDSGNPGRNYILTHYTYNSRTRTYQKSLVYPDRNLISSAKAPASYFVIGKDGESVQFILKKTGSALRVETADSFNVTLYAVKPGANEVMGNFVTLQEALSEIDRYAAKTNAYRVEISGDGSVWTEVTSDAKRVNLSMPKQTAGVTIATAGIDDESSPDDYALLYMNNSLTLNSDLTLEHVRIADHINAKNNTNNKLNISLGAYSLALHDVLTEDALRDDRIGGITGNGVNGNSALRLDNDDSGDLSGLRACGNISNVGTVYLNNAALESTGTVNIGSIVNRGGVITGTASVKTSDKTETIDGIKAKRRYAEGVVPNITVTKGITNIAARAGETPAALAVRLMQGGVLIDEAYIKGIMTGESAALPKGYAAHTGGYAAEAYEKLLAGNAYRVMKGLNVSADDIAYFGATSERAEDGSVYLLKNAGYVCFSTMPVNYTVSLAGEDTDDKISGFRYFADAVTEINNRNDKTADYVIETAGNSSNLAEPFNMPASNRYRTLTICNKPGHDGALLLYGNTKNDAVSGAVNRLTITGDTILKGVTFVNAHAQTRTPLTLALGGKKLTLDDVGFEGRALLIDGGRTGVLVLKGEKGLRAGSNVPGEVSANYVEGTISALGELSMEEGASLTVTDHIASVNRGADVYKPAAVTINTVTLRNNSISASGPLGGTLTLTDVTAAGDGISKLRAERDLGIRGTLLLNGNLALEGRQKYAKAGVPAGNVDSYISVGGAVSSDGAHKAYVTIRPYDMTEDGAKIVEDGEMIRLLTSAKCGMEHFAAVNTDKDGGEVQTIKMGNIIYAADRSSIGVALVQTAYTDDILINDDLSAERIVSYDTCETEQVEALGYYPTIADAVSFINSVNKKQDYVIVLLRDAGMANDTIAPISLSFPRSSAASGIGIISNSKKSFSGGSEASIEAEPLHILYSNAISLTSDLVMKDVVLTPVVYKTVNKVKVPYGGRLNISAGNYDLMLKNRGGTPAAGYLYDNGYDLTGAAIGNITANRAGGLILEDTQLYLAGSLNVGKLTLVRSALESEGSMTVHDIDNKKSGELRFKAGSLNITGRLVNEDEKLALTVYRNKDRYGNDIELLVRADKEIVNYSSVFSGKKLFSAACVTAGDVDYDTAGGRLIKLGSEFYCVENGSPILSNMVSLDRMEGGNRVNLGEYLDLNQALAQIASFADINASYTVNVGRINDTNVRDNNAHSGISMPGNNRAGLITIEGKDDDSRILYSGAISAYAGYTTETAGGYDGGLIFKELKLEPVGAGNNKYGEPAPANTNITLARNGSDRSGYPVLEFRDVEVGNDFGGHIANIYGTRGVTDVVTDSGLILTGSFGNVRLITVDGADVVCGGSAGAVGDLVFRGETPSLTSIGTMAVDNIILASDDVELGTVANGSSNSFTLRGGVLDTGGAVSSGRIRIVPYRAKSSLNPKKSISYTVFTGEEFAYTADSYVGSNVNLINAPKAYTGCFKADGICEPYKIGNGVYFDSKPMYVKLAWTEDGRTFETKAHTYVEAVAAIGTYAAQRDYQIVLSETSVPVWTAGKAGVGQSAVRGGISFPSYKNARSVTVRTDGSAPGKAVIEYTGSITPATNVCFDNVILKPGSVSRGAFIPAGNVTPVMNTGYDLTFTKDAMMYDAVSGVRPVTLPANISGSKGVLTVETADGAVRYVGAVMVSDTGADNNILTVYKDGHDVPFDAWDKAVSYINAVNDRTAEYKITLLDDIGGETDHEYEADSEERHPIDKLQIPSAAKKITIDDGDADYGIYFTGSTLNIPVNVELDGIALHAYTAKSRVVNRKKHTAYTPVSYQISVANNAELTMSDGSFDGISQITGATLAVTGEDAGNRTDVQADKNISVKNLIMENAAVHSTAINVSSKAELSGALADAGLSDAVGTGRLAIANLMIAGSGNELIAKQDKNGVSQLFITGTVTDVRSDAAQNGPVAVRILYNSRSTQTVVNGRPVQSDAVPHKGMVYITFGNRVKAEQYGNAGWFTGVYTRVSGTNAGTSIYCPVGYPTGTKSSQLCIP